MDALNKVSDGIRNGYYFFEDKWYDLLDKIDSKVPIYPVVDKIDAVIPSFILFLLILFFILILIGYFIQFSSPFSVTFTTLDSTTQSAISGVNIKTVILAQAEEGTTNSAGKFNVNVTDSSKNIYAVLGEMLFGKKETDLKIEVSARKTGYVDFIDTFYEGNEHELLLSPVAIPEPDIAFAGQTQIRLVDSSTTTVITDNTGEAYIKFSCNNKNIETKTVTSTNGVFNLIEPDCQFKFEEGFSPGYVKNASPKILPNNIAIHSISLTKINSTGGASIWIFADNNKNKPVAGATVNIGDDYSGTTNNSGFVLIKNILPGEYLVTVLKEGFHPIIASDEEKIIITKGVDTDKELYLTTANIEDQRKVRIKVVESIDGNTLPGTKVILRTLNLDKVVNGILVTKYADANGFIEFTSVTKAQEGRLGASFEKDGYLFDAIQPTLFGVESNSYDTVILEKANETNSGSAEINVKSKSGEIIRNLAGAKAGLVIEKIGGMTNFPTSTKTTNADGNVTILYLPKDHNYYAVASYQNGPEEKTQSQKLDANTTIYFNLVLDLDLSKIILNLKNTSGETITDANVFLYQVNNTSGSLNFKEKLTLSTNKFNSELYSKSNNYHIIINAKNYVPAFISIDSQIDPLSNGVNEFTKILTRLTDVDYEDANVAIKWGDIYRTSDTLWSEPNNKVSILYDNNTYRAQVTAFIAKENIDYNTLLQMIRTENAIIKNIYINPVYGKSKTNVFSCTNQNQDNVSSRTENYYLGGNADSCYNDTNKIVAGAKWSDKNVSTAYLEKGEYNLAIDFTIKLPVDQNEIIFNFRAKEENQIGNSETTLKEKRIKVGVPFREGVYLITKINNIPIIFNDNNTGEMGVTANITNELDFTIFNEISTALSGAKLTVYSHSGSPNTFSEVTNPPTGKIIFSNGEKKQIIDGSITVAPWTSKSFNTDFNFPNNYATDYIVVVFENGAKKETYFINISTEGLVIKLKHGDFLTGISNQTFYGTIEAASSLITLDPVIEEIELKVYTNGNVTPLHEFNLNSNSEELTLDKKSFEIIIPGDYIIGDYLTIKILAKEKDTSELYNPYNKTIYAGTGGTQDRTLGCIDIYETIDGNSRATVNWADDLELTIKNNCETEVELFIETGLSCKYKDNTLCQNVKHLLPTEQIKLNITGTNFNYNPSINAPNFTDLLGLFPVYVKAKFVNRNLFSNASNFSVNLINSNQCFNLVGWPEFDFKTNSADKDIRIENHCYYRDIKDYFIPNLNLHAFGYEINPNVLASNGTVNFDVDIELDGAPREFVNRTREVESRVSTHYFHADDFVIGTDKQVTTDGLATYTTEFDLSTDLTEFNASLGADWRYTDIQIKIIDNSTDVTKYGARINGNIEFTYEDDSTQSIAPVGNFKLSPSFARASGEVEMLRGDEFWSATLPANGLNVDEDNWVAGLIYQPIDNKKIKRVKIVFEARNEVVNEALMFGIWPQIKYTDHYTEEVVSSTTSNATVDIGNYSIPKIGGIKWVLATVNDLKNRGYFNDQEFISRLNPTLNRVIASDPNINVWVENGFLYAKYIGPSPYISTTDETYVDGKVSQVVGSGEIYGLVNVKDFVTQRPGSGIISGDVE